MPKRVLQGKVVSAKCEKTVTVLVTRKYAHPKLGKPVTTRKKYTAHDPNSQFKEGDQVSIIESKPHSKTKKFEVIYKTSGA